MNRTLYVTTTIPYVNAQPHIGFALELVQADALVRYHRLTGDAVRFQTGTDENAFKNVLTARSLGVPVRELVDRNAERFRALADALSIGHDRFVRTTDPAHSAAVHAFLQRLRPGDLYRASYGGRYCTGCEDFYLERDLNNGLCPEHGTPAAEVLESNHFFRLSAYQDEIRELIASRRLRIVPETRESEVLSFIDRGLDDISISRDAARSGDWGIPFPCDPEQVVYVWIDALVNYITGLGYPGGETARFWTQGVQKTHVIGKNVWKFHAIYWPALLLSAGLDVPDVIIVHGFLTDAGRKISKPRGEAPDPFASIARFGADAVRYFLLRHAHPFEDTEFSEDRLASAYASDLANGLGNLSSRVTALAEGLGLEGLSCRSAPPAPPEFHDHAAAFRFDLAIETLWEEIRAINRALGEGQPWRDIAAGETATAREKVARAAGRLATVAYWLKPFLPTTADAILSALTSSRIRRIPPIFPRLEASRAFARAGASARP